MKLPEQRPNSSPGTATAWNTNHNVSRQDIHGPLAPDQNSNHLSPGESRTSSGRARLDDEVSVHTRRDRGYKAAARRLQQETPDSSVPPNFARAEDNLVGIGSIFNPQSQHRPTSGSSFIEVMANSVEVSLVAYAGKPGAAKWLPVDKLLEIINEEDVHQALSEACKDRGLAEPILREYAAKVCGRLSYTDRAGQPTSSLGSRSMFAILVMIDKVDEIMCFIDHGFTDENLPLVPYGENDFPVYPGGLNPGEVQCFDLGKTWNRLQWRAFLSYQSTMRSPFFELRQSEKRLPHYELDRSTVLPFINDYGTQETTHGGFSMVRRIQIHSAHHDEVSYPPEEWCCLAFEHVV